ncbi:MAG: 30S ribosomal protein S11 [Patescibacteria group bacterium]
MTEDIKKITTDNQAAVSGGETDSKETATKKRRSKKKRQVARGQAHILATYNNTIVSLTDQTGGVLVISSAGQAGFKGAKKATPYAAGIIVKTAVEKAKDYGLKDVEVFVKGVGMGRDAAIRALYANGLNVSSIKDVTPVPHNGCRPRRPRRV